MKQLDRLLFLQGHCCFFCGRPIPVGEASVEHLVATSNGGVKADENCVACCKTLNFALGHLSLKDKLQAILNQRGPFPCPASADVDETAAAMNAPHDRMAVVVEDLQKRGAARPRRVATLKNTMNAAFKMSLSDAELDGLVKALKARGYVTIDDNKVTYELPPVGA